MNIAELFSDKNGPLPQVPQCHDGYEYGIEDFACVRVRTDKPNEQHTPPKAALLLDLWAKFPLVGAIPLPPKPGSYVPVECKQCNGAGELYECPECEGEGTVIYETQYVDEDKELDCPVCRAKGTLTRDEYTRLRYAPDIDSLGVEQHFLCAYCDGKGKLHQDKVFVIGKTPIRSRHMLKLWEIGGDLVVQESKVKSANYFDNAILFESVERGIQGAILEVTYGYEHYGVIHLTEYVN